MPASVLPARPSLSVVVAIGIAMALGAPPALAAWPVDSTTNVRLCTGAGPENDPVLVASTSIRKTGVIVAWTDYRNGASNTDIYAQRVAADGHLDTRWPAAGLAVCSLAGNQKKPAICSDGVGGAIIVWVDQRPFDGDGFRNIYAQHVRANGTLDAAWPATGAPVSCAAQEQSDLAVVSDGAGGVIVFWADTRSGDIDVFANRLVSTGAVHGSWPTDGRVVCNATFAQFDPRAVTDGANGAIATWADSRGSGDVYEQRMSGVTGMPLWTTNGVALCALASGQGNQAIVADGAGGAIVAWEDQRNIATSGSDVYAQHVTPAGVVDAAWPADGRAVATATQTQGQPVAISDAYGGMLVAYLDYRLGSAGGDLSAKHVLAGGTLDAGWGPNGMILSAATGSQMLQQLSTDGSGGLIACWNDQRAGNDIYALRVRSTGAVADGWPGDGAALCVATDGQSWPAIAAVDDGDAIAVWTDFRSGTARTYAQRVTGFGARGMTAPNLVAVQDVPNDQGGRVHVLWEGSAFDAAPYAGIADYRLWRRVMIGTVEYWEFLAQVPAKGAGQYAFMAPTTADSTAADAAVNTFKVTAHATDGQAIYTSGLLPGWSLDNLSPSAPQQLTGEFAAGTTTLAWSAPPDADVAAYRVYRGETAGFVADAAARVAELAATTLADAAGAPRWYRVSAVDAHGNEGPTALLAPGATTGAGPPGPPVALALSPPRPNPARGTAELELAMPSGAHVSCVVYDVGGRLVRVLLDAPLPPGTHRLAWDTADSGGAPAAGGLYFIRLEVAGARFVRRLAVLR